MADDDFEPFDIHRIRRKTQAQDAIRRAEAGERELTVMEMQQLGRERRPLRKSDAAPLVAGVDGAGPCYTLHGQPLRDGQVIEVYTNRANGFVKGVVVVRPWPERPKVRIVLWDAWGPRDVDGWPPRVGAWDLEIPDGARCRFGATLPQDLG